MSNSPLVSVVIPCYNQAHFLAEAIESVLAQTYPHFEIIVVDDGSSDNASEVAAAYPAVCCLQQHNQGLSAARNTGLYRSAGQYLVFLDADDRLLPRALESGLACLQENPESAFVFGRHKVITANGSHRSAKPHLYTGSEHYGALLQGNYIGMHATVMYQRFIFDAVGGFNRSLPACEDYDLYLRIARSYPITCHEAIVAEYRHHEANMSGNLLLMLTTVLDVLRLQHSYVKENKQYERMYKRGIWVWTYYYSQQWSWRIYRQLKARAWNQAMQTTLTPVQYALSRISISARGFLGHLAEVAATSWQRRFRLPVGQIDFGTLRQVTPFGYNAECTTTKSVEWYYIERFLDCHSGDLSGRVLAIGDTANIHQVINGPAVQPDLLHLAANDSTLAHISNLPSDSVDCIVIVQGLHYIYELEAMMQAIHRVLKPGGVLLATVSGIGHINQKQQACFPYWAFTVSSARRLFTGVFPTDNVKVEANGNVMAATAVLQGLEAKMLQMDELDYIDPRYPLLITIRAVKPTTLP